MKKIIDVREADEYTSGHLDEAISIPLSELESDFELATKELDIYDEIIVYCRSGGRASIAQERLLQNGFKNVLNGINQDSISGQRLSN